MRAAVTGGAGFIGSHLVDALLAQRAEVLVVDDLSRGRTANLATALSTGAELACIDVCDGAAVTAAFTAFAPEVVFHLAAQIDVRASMVEPARDARVNVIGSVNVFAAAAAAGTRRVVNTSTGGALYGLTAVVPTPETEQARPVSAYGMSKRTAEEYAGWFRSAHALDVVTLRYGNVYGPRQDPATTGGVVAVLCDHVLRGKRPTVFGDGQQTRDFVFVGDVVAANLAAALAPSLRFDRYNVGTGAEVSVLELVEAVAAAAGAASWTFTPELRPARLGEVPRSCLDVSRARAELGPREATPLATGLRSTLDWTRRRSMPVPTR